MMLRLSRLAHRATLPLVAVALVVGLLAAALPGAALAQNSAQDQYNSGRDMLQSGDYAGAVNAFSRAISADPNMAQAYLGRATAYAYQGNSQAALQDYNQALQLQPGLAEALYNRGVLLARTGDLQGAVRDLQQAADAFRQRGDEQTAGLVSEAINTLQQQQ